MVSRKYGSLSLVKTTIDIPDAIFRRAKVGAAMRGISLRKLVTDAFEEKIAADSKSASPPGWMSGFGGLTDLYEETRRIDSVIREEFRALESEDRQ